MIKDKKNMKKRWKRIISNMIAIALVIISSIPTISIPVKAEASVDGKLITVGGKTVTKNMKIDDVKKMFGEPKLTTPSYWDGYAYTFYGKDYSDYLYLETDSDGKIVCYGSVSPGFETNKYSYGEKVNPYARAGCEAKDDDGKLYAVIYYTKFHLDAYKRFTENFIQIIYVFLTIFLYLLKCPQSLILSALRAFFFCGKPHISRSIFLYFRYQSWLKSW